jgi:hypothetical protein
MTQSNFYHVLPELTNYQYRLLLDIFKWAKNEKWLDENIVVLIDDLRVYIEDGTKIR